MISGIWTATFRTVGQCFATWATTTASKQSIFSIQHFQTRGEFLVRLDREVPEASGEGRWEGEADGQRLEGAQEPDGFLLPHDQQHLGPDHLPAAREQGPGTEHLVSNFIPRISILAVGFSTKASWYRRYLDQLRHCSSKSKWKKAFWALPCLSIVSIVRNINHLLLESQIGLWLLLVSAANKKPSSLAGF